MYGLRCGISFGHFPGRLPELLEISRSLGCNSAQFAIGDPTDYWPDDLKDRENEILLFRKDASHYDLFLHAPYLINLASPREDIWKPSIRATFLLRKIAYNLGVGAIIIHAGSHDDSGLSAGIKREADAIKFILKNEAGFPVKFLIENTAGGKNSIGGQPKNIKSIIEKVNDKKVGMVLDTAHAYAAGIDLNNPKSRRSLRKYYEDYIEAIHLNDTGVDLGSHIDKHTSTHLGEGEITPTAFASFVEEYTVPLIVETQGKRKAKDIEKIKAWGKPRTTAYDREQITHRGLP